nr:SurA N-terminal domain-containing protein [uncultured Desulfobacter sp.]
MSDIFSNIGHGITEINGSLKDRLRSSFLCALWCMAAGVIIATGLGCKEQKNVEEKGCIIKAGTVEISQGDFARELEVKQANYPYEVNDSPDEYNAMVLDLVSDLSDEAVLLAAAADKGIDVTDEELESAVDDFKKDYPEDSFDQMLLERAISYSVWEKGLKKDLVIQKLIMQDLVAAQQIHAEDMIAFYDRLAGRNKSQDDDSTMDDNSTMVDENDLVLRLRIEKSQDAYGEWIQGLQASYPVHIDKLILSTFLMDTEKK